MGFLRKRHENVLNGEEAGDNFGKYAFRALFNAVEQ